MREEDVRFAGESCEQKVKNPHIRSQPRATGRTSGCFTFGDSLQPANQQLALIDHFRRQPIVQIKEQLFLTEDFLTPGAVIERL